MQSEILLKIARTTIQEKFDSKTSLNKEQLIKDFPFLNELGASFVTLTLNNQLRGCIGSLEAYRSLLDDLISNSYASAFEDPRFYELTKEELEKVNIEVSVLSVPIEVIYSSVDDLKSKIKKNIHGVILQKDGRRSTFLPQVWEQLSSFEEFFSKLCYKGGFEEDCLNSFPQIFVYEVNKIKEKR
jgi:uncharacterized protein